MVRTRSQLYVLSICLALLPVGLSQAEPLYPDPSVVVQSPVNFRLDQSLHGDPGHPQAHGGIGLHWASSAASHQRRDLQPDSILQLDESVAHVVLADLREHRVYLLENGPRLRLLREMYGSIGKNGSGKQIQDDGRTPLGVYTVTRRIEDEALPELYGTGAFPVDYPNAWDRWHQRTGYGIWLHGVPRDKYSRPPLSSEGCVAVSNEDLDSLKAFVEPGNTRVVFSDGLNWVEAAELARERQDFLARVQAWRDAWSSLDTRAYLDFYAAEFSTPQMSRDQFVAHKTMVNASKRFIEIELDQLNAFNYPDGEQIRLVEFTQHYRSNNYASVDRKRQFWQQAADGQWYILREASL